MSTSALEPTLAPLLDLKQRLAAQGHSPALAARTAAAVAALPADLPAPARSFAEEVAAQVQSASGTRPERLDLPTPPTEELAEGAMVAGADLTSSPGFSPTRGRNERYFAALRATIEGDIAKIKALGLTLPLRANITERPGHVERVTPPHSGLIHGATVFAAGARLVIKAYRFFEYTHVGGGANRHVEVVAGVCDHFDAAGRLLETWSTAERLQPFYSSTAVALPAGSCEGQIGSFRGFYRSASFLSRWLNSPMLPPQGAVVDDGVPDPYLCTGQPLRAPGGNIVFASAFQVGPGPAEALEHPFFVGTPAKNSAFVVDTSFVTVFSAGAESPHVLVALPSVFRDATIDLNGRVTRFTRQAAWRVRLFS